MAETRSYPETITTSLPGFSVKCEEKYKDYDLTDITHVVVHLSDTIIRNLRNSRANDFYGCDNKDYWEFIEKMLSVTLFGNENQLEWINTYHCFRRSFVALANIEKKEEREQSQSLGDAKTKVIEVMFMQTNPREMQKIFWRPAREIVHQSVVAELDDSVETSLFQFVWE
ncbi:uncharacterized protein N7479_007549 [Penicillium vulpinum]|uniref:Uncharacterized protein n=1 Tax=Penicillium vulpinum TaxID=29845 RepID=A0A1V6SAU0_9EURO|nr:uncharacterized protein N7479_007549 [Penicillium vulpinum]KAJ5960399.1 hypothetical protein N7479_007549 [Penicillium vulpinum]OQE10988.1 hypothetical protein PENVUL_c003G01008 [Penicillium vulpinum]